MSGNTSETRCKHCQKRIAFSGNYWLQVEASGYLGYEICQKNPNGRHEPTPPEGEAVTEQRETPKYWQCPNNEAHPLKFGEKIYGTSTYRMYCLDCPNTVAVFRSKPIPAPVVSTAAPEPPQIKVQRYDPIAEIQEIADNLAQSGDCIGSLKLEAAINILRPAATPVTVEAPHPLQSWQYKAAFAIAKMKDSISTDHYDVLKIMNVFAEFEAKKSIDPQPPCSECATLRKERDDARSELFLSGVELTKQRSLAIVARLNAALWKGKLQAAEAQLSTHTKTLLHIQKTVKGDWANYLDQIDEVRCTVSAALAPTPEVAPKEGKL